MRIHSATGPAFAGLFALWEVDALFALAPDWGLLHILLLMNPKQTNEKRKVGPTSVFAGVAVGLVVLFELAYIVMATMPEGRLVARFSPNVSDEDRAMLESNIPGVRRSQKKDAADNALPAEAEEAVTAVDAALLKAGSVTNAASGIVTDSEGIPSAITGADEVQWTVVNTNELKEMARKIAATNALIEAASTNALPESTDPDPEETPAEAILPVG